MRETLTFRPSKKNADLLDQLEKLAEAEHRSLNNYLELILLTHLSSVGKKKKK